MRHRDREHHTLRGRRLAGNSKADLGEGARRSPEESDLEEAGEPGQQGGERPPHQSHENAERDPGGPGFPWLVHRCILGT